MKPSALAVLYLVAALPILASATMDLAVSKTQDIPAPSIGDVVTYTLTVTNAGDEAGTSATVRDTLPPGVFYLNSSNGAYNATTGVWSVGAVGVGSSTSLLVQARVLIPPGIYGFVTNPVPTVSNYFGYAVACVGSNKFVVGAYGERNNGVAYLFDDAGILLATFTNPAPDTTNRFGFSVAGLGEDKVIIGAPYDSVRSNWSGRAFIFQTDGTLLVTLTNPAPWAMAYFGYAVAPLDNDRFIVGANGYRNPAVSWGGQGRAYLYQASGNLLTTFNHPNPTGIAYFGSAVVGLGTDKVAIGAYGQYIGGSWGAGQAYIFNTNGVVLATITNPAPSYQDYFGQALAALDADTLAVSAPYEDTPADTAGSVYLYNSAGVLQKAIPNPAGTANEGFGYSLAAWGADRFIAGAPGARVDGISQAGSAYVVDTNGALLAKLPHPDPVQSDAAGGAVALVGSNKVAVGAYRNDTGATDAGMVFLFEQDSGGAVVRNTAALTASDPADINPANNSGTVVFAVGIGTDLAIGKAGAYSQLFPKTTNTYTITVTNRGPAVANNIRTMDLLPNDLWFLSATPTRGWYETATNRWRIGALQPGEGASMTLLAKVLESWPRSLTVTNPQPRAMNDFFGSAVAPLGPDRMIVGMEQGGTNRPGAFLVGLDGDVLASFSSPTPAASAYFGCAAAGVGEDKALVGAWQHTGGGRAYLFDTNGTWLLSVTNPLGSSGYAFGTAVAGLGTDRFIVGSQNKSGGSNYAGEAHIYDTNGTLLVTVTNPLPQVSAAFSTALSPLGDDRVIVGAQGYRIGSMANVGQAYIYNRDGQLLVTITNPAPRTNDYFGRSVAAFGADRVIVGAPWASGMSTPYYPGRAYIFDTNGVLQATIEDPAQKANGSFGRYVAAVDTNRFIVAGASLTPRPYLFDAGGDLIGVLYTPSNMPPHALAGVGAGRAAVASKQAGTAQTNTYGEVYLFDLQALSYYTTNRVTMTCAQAVTTEANSVASAILLVGTGGGSVQIVLSATNVNARENGEGRFYAKLDGAPSGDTTVTVARASGDTDITVSEGASLVFTPANWDTWQRVTLAAANDGDAAGGTATIQATAPDAAAADVTATELDDDIGSNIALASGGSTAAGGGFGARTIDGMHTSSTNYGYTVWTNVPPDAMTLDLKATATVARVRLLNWDWSLLYQRYQIESSLDGATWTPLADASAADRTGWDDWDAGSVNARYLRLTGLTNTGSKGVIVAEWEVYGARPPAPAVNRSAVNARENGEGRFFVRLSSQPAANTTVSVARVSGDTDLSVSEGATLVFTPANWSAWQRVTLAAADDPDTDNGAATFRVATPGAGSSTDVTATELDDDIGANAARSSAGSTISGGSYAPRLIDGTHTSSANYGYTVWTNTPTPALTLDLKAATVLSRLRLLNWDWSVRYQRYQVESSMDGSTWSNLVDASTGQHTGWEDAALDGRQARYLRLTGQYSSAGGVFAVAEWEVYGARVPGPVVSRSAVNVRENGEGRFFVKLDAAPAANTTVSVARVSGDADVSVTEGASLVFTPANWSAWQRVTLAGANDVDSDNDTATIRATAPGATSADVTATELDDDIGTNLALSSGGSTIAGGSYPGRAIDGIHASSTNYAYCAMSATITLDLKSTATVARIRLLNWDWSQRYQRYQIEASVDGATWSNVVNASAGSHAGWEDWAIASEPARYLRLTALYASTSSVFAVTEWEVYAAGGGGGGARRAGTWRMIAGGSVVPGPGTVVTGDDGPGHTNGWPAVDGNLETYWEGRAGSAGWYISVGYDAMRTLTNLDLYLAADSLTNVLYLYSLDAETWRDLVPALELSPVELKYLWLVFPADGTTATPKVQEIRPQP